MIERKYTRMWRQTIYTQYCTIEFCVQPTEPTALLKISNPTNLVLLFILAKQIHDLAIQYRWMLIITQMEECMEQTVNKVCLLIFKSYSMIHSPFPAM